MGFHFTKFERDAVVDERESREGNHCHMCVQNTYVNRQRLQKHKIPQFEIAVVDRKYNGEKI